MMSLRTSFIVTVLLVSSLVRGQNADINLLRDIHDPQPVRGDKPMLFISNSVLPMMFAVPIGIGIYNYATTNSLTTNREHFVVTGAVISASALTLGLKYAVNRPRPFVSYSDITQKDAHAGPYSFPSGHTANAFALATSVSLCYPKWYVVAPAFAWAVAVGYSRMWLGVHYPSDVLIGALIGTACSFGSYYLMRSIR